MGLKYKKNGQFKCRYCGVRFDLTGEEAIALEYSFYEPDCCDDCADNLVNQDHEIEAFSDADPGL